MNWIYNGVEVTDIKQFPEDTYGFIYCISFDDGKYYIGKKALYIKKKMKSLKNGKVREGSLKHNSRSEVVMKESDWKKYCGSGHHYDKTKITKKEIMYLAKNKLELSYMETSALFASDVLHDENSLNYNIQGKYYRGSV